MALVQLFRGANEYEAKLHLSVPSAKGHLVGVGSIELTGFSSGMFGLNGPTDSEVEDLLLSIGTAAAARLEEKIDDLRRLQDAAEATKRERASTRG